MKIKSIPIAVLLIITMAVIEATRNKLHILKIESVHISIFALLKYSFDNYIYIIIIIILAGAIILSLTNSNVIGKAGLAKASNDFAQIKQMVEMARADVMLSGGNVNVTVPQEYANDIHISEIGGIFLKPGGTKITDPDIIEKAITVMGAAYLPTGFEHLEGTIDEGIVIINEEDDNEFVWVPVPNYSEFVRENFFNQVMWESYKEYGEITPETSQPAEYKAMRASIAKYKGFYIARYEAGIATGMSAPTSDTTATYGGGEYKPVSKPNTFVWNHIKWSTSGSEMTSPTTYVGDPSTNGAVKVARAMYPVGTTPVGSPVSTLIYGEQWDAAMRYMKDVPNPNVPGAKYITNSTGMGEYTEHDYDNWDGLGPPQLLVEGQLEKTASNTKYKVKNIYDMAGNLDEWTMEALSTYNRVMRGGIFAYSGAEVPSSVRRPVAPDYSDGSVGFRPALYIK